MVFNKVKFFVIFSVIVIIGVLFTLWRVTSIKLKNTQDRLTEITYQLDTVTKENELLVEYNKRRDNQIKQLEKEYQEQLNSIPKDICGDTKPSKEMIEFFKQGI